MSYKLDLLCSIYRSLYVIFDQVLEEEKGYGHLQSLIMQATTKLQGSRDAQRDLRRKVVTILLLLKKSFYFKIHIILINKEKKWMIIHQNYLNIKQSELQF